MTDSVLMQGFDLMIVGMGTVFAFLGLLVAAMTVMSRITMRLRTHHAGEFCRGR